MNSFVYGLLVTCFVLSCFLLIFLILLQKGKSSMGLGGLGGGTQMLFGGSGGQDIFQKITWVLGAILIFGSLALSIMKTTVMRSRYTDSSRLPQPALPAPQQTPSQPGA